MSEKVVVEPKQEEKPADGFFKFVFGEGKEGIDKWVNEAMEERECRK